MANSTAVVSDGIESAGDVLGSGLVLFGLILAAKPPDEEHPYGHGRLETLSALGVGVLLAAIGALICFRAIELAFAVPHSPQAFGGWPLLGCIVVFLGFKVVRDTALHLMDTMPAGDAIRQIREVALSVPGALGIEKCFARKTGLQYHADLHLEVDPLLSVQASHDIATQVRFRIIEQLDWVADVLVHVEPFLAGTISSRHGES